MRITNITGKNGQSNAKIIGFRDISIFPGETKEIPDAIAYIPVFDRKGKENGKTILPSILVLEKTGQISYEETEDDEPEEDNDSEEIANDETAAPTEEEKKAAAKKRAEARAAKKAAKEAAEAAAAAEKEASDNAE